MTPGRAAAPGWAEGDRLDDADGTSRAGHDLRARQTAAEVHPLAQRIAARADR